MAGMMTSHPVKRVVQGGLSLKKEPPTKRLREETSTYYKKWIICRGLYVRGLNNIQAATKDKLLVAMTAQQDEIFTKLHSNVTVETWLTDNLPKWHEKCHNWYINEKSYKLAEKKRMGLSAPSRDMVQPGCRTSSQQSIIVTRRTTSTFNNNDCVICGKRWLRANIQSVNR